MNLQHIYDFSRLLLLLFYWRVVNDITNFRQIWIRKHCQICFILDFTPCIKITPGKLPNNQLSGIFCAGIPDCFCHDSGSADRTDLSQSKGFPPALHKGKSLAFVNCCLNIFCCWLGINNLGFRWLTTSTRMWWPSLAPFWPRESLTPGAAMSPSAYSPGILKIKQSTLF